MPELVTTTEEESKTEMSVASVDQGVRSRERVLALLNDKLPKDTQGTQLLEQLAIRDARLEECQARILALEGESKIGANDALSMKTKQVQGLQEERDSLLETVKSLEAAAKEQGNAFKQKIQKLTEDKENAEALSEGLTEELEATRAQVKTEQEKSAGMRQDLVQLSRIVQEMSKLNTELNEKIAEMNKDMETKNAEHYTATVKAQHTEELEAALNAEVAKAQSIEKKLAKLTEDKVRLDALEEVSRLSQEALRILEEEVTKTDHPKTREFVENIQRVRHELKKSTAAQRPAKEDVATLKETIKQLQSEKAALDIEHRRLVSIENVHLERIRILEQEKAKLQSEAGEGNDRLQRKVKLLQESADKFRQRTEKAEDNYQHAEAELQKTLTQVATLKEKGQALKEQAKEKQTAADRAEETIRDLRSQLAGFKGQQNAQNSSLMNREMKMKQAAARMKALSDEVWKKETEVLRKEGQRLKLEQEVKSLKDTLQQTQATAKVKAASDFSALEAKLEEKDREIAILKDMLRSSSHQVKHRDLDISRFRMKLEGAASQSIDGPASSPETTERSGKVVSLVLELDSLLCVREKLASGQKLPNSVLKKRLRVDQLPSDPEGVQHIITKRLELLVEELQRESRAKAEVVVHAKSVEEKLVSDAVRGAWQGQSSCRVADLVPRLKQAVNC